MKKKLKRFKMYAMFMALIMMISSEAPYVFAAENEATEDLVIETSVTGDMEAVVINEETTAAEKELTAEELDVTITGEEPVIYGGEEQIAAMSDDTGSSLYNWTVSGYLSKSGDYALYKAELPAGSYLQARLSVPNNNTIDYDLVLYDSALSVIKASDYITYLNAAGAIAESIGYKASTTETVYIGAFSSLGGSDTEAYTLEFSIATNYSEANEPNENAKEAIGLTFANEASATVSGVLNSAIDNDWYSFTVLEGPKYDKVRLDMDFVSKTNDYNIEIYRNLSSGYYAMQLVAYGKGGQITLPAGTYFLRVVCTNTLSSFNVADYPTYKLSVSPVGRVDAIEITKYVGYKDLSECEYSQGTRHRIMEVLNAPNSITIYGRAYYQEGTINQFASKNVLIDAVITDPQWEGFNPDWVRVRGSAVTNDTGYFEMNVYLNPPRGGLQYMGSRYLHLYDLMDVLITTPSNEKVGASGSFYYERQIN